MLLKTLSNPFCKFDPEIFFEDRNWAYDCFWTSIRLGIDKVSFKIPKSFLNLISTSLNKKPKIKLKSLQKGDVVKTHASVSKLNKKINFKPKYNLDDGIKLFISWYKKYFYG